MLEGKAVLWNREYSWHFDTKRGSHHWKRFVHDNLDPRERNDEILKTSSNNYQIENIVRPVTSTCAFTTPLWSNDNITGRHEEELGTLSDCGGQGRRISKNNSIHRSERGRHSGSWVSLWSDYSSPKWRGKILHRSGHWTQNYCQCKESISRYWFCSWRCVANLGAAEIEINIYSRNRSWLWFGVCWHWGIEWGWRTPRVPVTAGIPWKCIRASLYCDQEFVYATAGVSTQVLSRRLGQA